MPIFIRIVDIDDKSLGKRNSNSFTAIVPFVIFFVTMQISIRIKTPLYCVYIQNYFNCMDKQYKG